MDYKLLLHRTAAVVVQCNCDVMVLDLTEVELLSHDNTRTT